MKTTYTKDETNIAYVFNGSLDEINFYSIGNYSFFPLKSDKIYEIEAIVNYFGDKKSEKEILVVKTHVEPLGLMNFFFYFIVVVLLF